MKTDAAAQPAGPVGRRVSSGNVHAEHSNEAARSKTAHRNGNMHTVLTDLQYKFGASKARGDRLVNNLTAEVLEKQKWINRNGVRNSL